MGWNLGHIPVCIHVHVCKIPGEGDCVGRHERCMCLRLKEIGKFTWNIALTRIETTDDRLTCTDDGLHEQSKCLAKQCTCYM